MPNQGCLATLLIGSIAVETESLFIARRAAEIVTAAPESERPGQGVVLVDGLPVKWRSIAYLPKSGNEI